MTVVKLFDVASLPAYLHFNGRFPYSSSTYCGREPIGTNGAQPTNSVKTIYVDTSQIKILNIGQSIYYHQ